MSLSDLIMIGAILLAPVIAVQVSQWVERRRIVRERRLVIFRALMTTRRSRLSPEHIQALNMIDVEFKGTDAKSRRVVDAWKEYLDHLNTGPVSDVWAARREDLFIALLYEIAVALDYSFDKTHLRRATYYPVGLGELEDDQHVIRKAVREILEGKRWLPIWVGHVQTQSPPQQNLTTPEELAQAEPATETVQAITASGESEGKE